MHCVVDSLTVVREIRSIVPQDTLNHVWLSGETMPHTHTPNYGTVPATTRLLGYFMKGFRWELTIASRVSGTTSVVWLDSPCTNGFRSVISESAADTLVRWTKSRR